MAAVHPSLSTHIESNDSINQNNIIISPLNSPGPVIKLCINIKVPGQHWLTATHQLGFNLPFVRLSGSELKASTFLFEDKKPSQCRTSFHPYPRLVIRLFLKIITLLFPNYDYL